MKKKNFKSKYTIIKHVFEKGIDTKKKLKSSFVEFPNNFASEDKIIETTINLDHEINSGFSKHYVFNGIRIEYRNLNLLTPLEAEVSLNFPYFKMHFLLDGYYSYKASNSKSLDIHIPKGQHQIYFFPEIKEGIMTYGSENITNKTLEITLSLGFIYRVFRNSWEVLDVLGDAIKKDIPSVFGGSSQVISPEIYSVIQQIQNSNFKTNLQKAYLEAKVIELLVLQINDLEKVKNTSYNNEIKHFSKIKAAKAFIAANIDSNLTIPFIAKNVGLNVNYLKSEFKELYGETIFQYLTSLRMQHAYDLINYTDLPVAEIATRVGYKYPQHFTKTFKKYYLKTPSELRKKL